MPSLQTRFALAAAIALGAAPSFRLAAQPNQPCFEAGDIKRYAQPNSMTVLLRLRDSEVYRLDLRSSCPDVDWTYGFNVRLDGRRLCQGDNLDQLLFPDRTPSGSGMSIKCRVHRVHRLSASEIEALPASVRP